MSDHQERDELQEDPLATEQRDTQEHQESRWTDVRSAAQQAVRRASATGAVGWKTRFSGLTGQRVLPVALILGGVVVAASVAYFGFARASTPAVQPPPRQSSPATGSQPAQTTAPEGDSGLRGLFGGQDAPQQDTDPWPVSAAKITLKLALGALLAALLAFRPRRDLPGLQRNPYVAQTQILLAIVAAALMMVVADNAARAFGIFAAASLVRFRTNIRDPKEITVLLMSLGIGLASGVGKVEVAIILSLFSLLVLSVLEYYEPEQIFRAMELTVSSRKVEETDEILREIFEKRNMTSELRKVDREDSDNPIGKIVYYVNVNGHLSTDKLSEEIFSSDPENIDSIQWDQKKTSSYIYR
jgi:uncharacterized membrane protein YhiD involved in acid resistance